MKQIKHIFTGTLNIILFISNLLIVMIPFLPTAIVKLAFPAKKIRIVCDFILIQICTLWIDINNLIIAATTRTEWVIENFGPLNKKGWYLLTSNHQSWVDILALHKVFNRKIPFLRFFIKKQLLAVPILGFTWWALDYPTMRRYSREKLEKNPELKGKDLEETRIACEKFKNIPVTMMNFAEGTRFTDAKHKKQSSPFKHLLKAKAGGIAFVLGTMGSQMDKLIDVTIKYSHKNVTFWQYLSGQIKKINVKVNIMDIPPQLIGDYYNDEVFKKSFQNWLNQLWEQKDIELSSM